MKDTSKQPPTAFTLRLAPHIYEELMELCRRSGSDRAAVVGTLVRQAIAKSEPPFTKETADPPSNRVNAIAA